MKKKQKLSLEALKLASFKTTIENKEDLKVKGGGRSRFFRCPEP